VRHRARSCASNVGSRCLTTWLCLGLAQVSCLPHDAMVCAKVAVPLYFGNGDVTQTLPLQGRLMAALLSFGRSQATVPLPGVILGLTVTSAYGKCICFCFSWLFFAYCSQCPAQPDIHTLVRLFCFYVWGGGMLHGHFHQTTMALPARVEPGEPHKL
jgi:hypothetical protein